MFFACFILFFVYILLFTNTVKHAKLISSLLRSSIKPRINAQYIHGETHTDERCKFISDFRQKKIQVLCNVDILTTGFDAPEVELVAHVLGGNFFNVVCFIENEVFVVTQDRIFGNEVGK